MGNLPLSPGLWKITPLTRKVDARQRQARTDKKPRRFSGEKCRHNVENADYDIACDECDYFLICFPEWEEEFAKTEERYFGMSETMRQEPIFPLKKNFQKRVDFT